MKIPPRILGVELSRLQGKGKEVYSSQSEGYSSKWLIWLVYWELLYVVLLHIVFVAIGVGTMGALGAGAPFIF